MSCHSFTRAEVLFNYSITEVCEELERLSLSSKEVN